MRKRPDPARAADPLDARRVAARTIYDGRVVELRLETVEFADGTRREREIVVHPGAVAIVALDGSEIVLVRQHRAPAEAVLLEIPAGTRDRGADGAIEDPRATAERELAEETGLRAARMECLGRLYFAYGMSSQPVDVWLATGLEPGERALEDTEADLRVARFAVAELEAMIRRGEVRDAASVAAWHLVSSR